jgi:hypothetical protein
VAAGKRILTCSASSLSRELGATATGFRHSGGRYAGSPIARHTREIQLALLGVAEIAEVRHQNRDDGAQPLDDPAGLVKSPQKWA